MNECSPISPSYMRSPSSMPPSPQYAPLSPQVVDNDDNDDEPSGIEWSEERKAIEEEIIRERADSS